MHSIHTILIHIHILTYIFSRAISVSKKAECKIQSQPTVNILMIPLYPALKQFAFFRVSKLTHCRPKEAVQFGPRLKPCKRQTASTARHGWQLRSTMDVTDHRVLLLETICVSPVVFLALAARETPAPERSEGERGRVPCLQRPQKTRGESMLEEEAPCDQLPVDHFSSLI